MVEEAAGQKAIPRGNALDGDTLLESVVGLLHDIVPLRVQDALIDFGRLPNQHVRLNEANRLIE